MKVKSKNNRGLLSDIFLQDASFKRYWCQGGLDVMKKILKNTLELPYNLVFKNMYHTQGVTARTLGRQMREISAMLGWLLLLYLVCVLCQSA